MNKEEGTTSTSEKLQSFRIKMWELKIAHQNPHFEDINPDLLDALDREAFERLETLSDEEFFALKRERMKDAYVVPGSALANKILEKITDSSQQKIIAQLIERGMYDPQTPEEKSAEIFWAYMTNERVTRKRKAEKQNL